LEKFFSQQQACFPFLSNHGKQAKKKLHKCTTFRHVKHKRSKTKAPKQKKEKKQNQRISKTQKEANPKLRTQKQQNQSSKHPKLPTKRRSKTKESAKQTPPKLSTLNLLRCNRTCFCAAAADATTTTAIPLQLQSSRKLHYPKAQNFCFSLQQPNDDFCFFFFSPFFQKNI
jgi:hypothetical protein